MAESRTNIALRQTVAAGAAAGDVTVTGIKVGDVIKSVILVDFTAGSMADLTDEFEITDTDTINNAGGTASTGEFLLVTYIASHASGGGLHRGD